MTKFAHIIINYYLYLMSYMKICEQCQLIMQLKKGQAYEINEKEHFDNFPPGNKYEFNSLINDLKNTQEKAQATELFDFKVL